MTTDTKPVVERVYPPKIMMLLANPLLRRLLRRPGSGPSKGLMLLAYTGRKSGRHFETPVAKQEIDGELATLTNSGWRHNFRGGHPCELWLDGRRTAATGALVEDTAMVVTAYRTVLDRLGPGQSRRAGVRINADRAPTDQELAAAVQRYGLAYVRFSLDG